MIKKIKLEIDYTAPGVVNGKGNDSCVCPPVV
jgi:hypothetical protein